MTNNKNRLNSIADRIKYLLDAEGISTYEFCKQENILKKRVAFDRALTIGNPNNVSAIFIKAVYERYKDKISMLWLFYGDDDNSVQRYIDKIRMLEKEKNLTFDIIKKSYAEIKNIVDNFENTLSESEHIVSKVLKKR